MQGLISKDGIMSYILPLKSDWVLSKRALKRGMGEGPELLWAMDQA
jgi:hypothetical protein